MKKKFYTLLFALLAIVVQVQAQVILNAENFPDANFRAALAGILGINEGDEISQEKINATTQIDVSDKSISDLKGIEHFTALTYLWCDNNQLTALDTSNNTALTYLWCSYNQLTTLDLSKNTALRSLTCFYNQLTALDVSKNTALTTLYCYYNQLTELDLSKNTALTLLACYNNQIKGAQMDALVNSLPTISSGKFYVFNSSDNSEGNVCTKAQVAIAKSKGWKVYQFNGTAWPEYEGSGEGVLLNAENFPDANFRAALANILGISEGETITQSKINATTSLYVFENISNLKGIEHFTALTILSCSDNQLTDLDVSKNTALTTLYCYNNQLTTLDVSNNTALTRLDCYNNQLTALDVSNNTALTTLYCYSNQLTALDVSNNTALTILSCSDNPLTALDVSNNTVLKELSCYSNQLTDLDVSNNTALAWLWCYSNQLTDLDVSNNTALKNLVCYSNLIKGAAMDALVTSLPTVTSGTFSVIDTQNENEGNVCTKTQVNAAKAKGWTVYDNNGNNEVDYEGSGEGVLLNAENFPDANFRAALADILGINEGDEISQEKINATTQIDVSDKSISDLKGIEHFTALTTLYCDYNQLTTLDVSKNTALTNLDCYNNQLTALDVSKNTTLTNLDCNNNQLTALDVSKNTALTSLECVYNQLTTLDVSKNTALTSLECDYNQLTTLDVSKNTALTFLNCINNQLTALDVSKNTALTELVCYNNQLTALDVSKNTALTYLDCSDNQLTALDVSKNTALTYLECGSNQLTALDVSKNTALTSLECVYNQLTTLDVSKNTTLTNLDCYNNQLTALDVSKNTALTSLECYNNQLTALDVSKNTALTSLECDYNQLTTLDVSKNTTLTNLDCSNNQLTALDVSKNTALTSLYCYNNQIKGAKMDALVTSLPTVTSGLFYVIDTQDENEGNVCTKTQVNAAKAKGWKVWDYNGGNRVEYEGSDELILNEDNFTDSNFRATLSQILGLNEGDEITPEMIDEITTLNVSNKTISNLKGIEHFKELMVLYCQLNQIKGADMDDLIASLPTIDTSSAAPALNAPRKTSGTWGALYAYDNTAGNEGNVITTEQVADANAKGWKVYQFNGTAWEEYAGSTTGITIVENNGDAIDKWYTLDGKPLSSKPEKAGMYIVEMSNGLKKKVMVK